MDDRGGSRALSIATAPQEDYIQMITHCPEKGSTFKKALQQLQPGAKVEVSQPGGNFVFQEREQPFLFLVGGIGISAVRSILIDQDLQGKSLNGRLVYYAWASSFIFQDDLNRLAQKHPGFTVDYVVKDDLQEFGGIKDIETEGNTPVYLSAVYLQEQFPRDEANHFLEHLTDERRGEAEMLTKSSKIMK